MNNLTRFSQVTILMALILAGCAEMQARQLKAEFFAAREACIKQFPDAVGNMVKQNACIKAAADQYILPVYPYLDIYNLRTAYAAKTAQDIDQGKVSLADGRLEDAEFASKLTSIETARAQGQEAVDAQHTAASAAMLGVAASIIQNSQPQPPIIVTQPRIP